MKKEAIPSASLVRGYENIFDWKVQRNEVTERHFFRVHSYIIDKNCMTQSTFSMFHFGTGCSGREIEKMNFCNSVFL
jgi:hypothetical protein